MNKNTIATITGGIITIGVIALAVLLPADAKTFTPASTGIVAEGDVVSSASGWNVHVGSGGGYSRITYQLPEREGKTYTSFYTAVNVVIPPDFYTKPRVGFRILNTDNFTAKLNGVSVGAKDANELRLGLNIWKSDNLMHLILAHETVNEIELWKSPAPLPVGEHWIEMSGDTSKVAQWYLKIDGITVASGTRQICTPEMLPAECVVTRFRAGMDGAAGTGANMSLLVKSLSISEGASIIAPTITAPTVTISPAVITSTPAPECVVFPRHNQVVCLQ